MAILLNLVKFAKFLHFFPQAGVPLRLFHKEIEAYLCAEGLFDDEVTENGTVKLV